MTQQEAVDLGERVIMGHLEFLSAEVSATRDTLRHFALSHGIPGSVDRGYCIVPGGRVRWRAHAWTLPKDHVLVVVDFGSDQRACAVI